MNSALLRVAAPRHLDETYFPVVVVGAGPTGLTLANLLGTYGVRTLTLERSANVLDEPRAVSIDDESLRTLQAANVVEDVVKQIVNGYGTWYYSWRGKKFAEVEPTTTEYGFQKRNAFRQEVLVGRLRDSLKRFEHASLWFEHEVVRFVDEGNSVLLTVKHADGIKHVRCDWLVACDGGRSGTREQLGISLVGKTYDKRWLIVDLVGRMSPFRHTRTFCDPARPAIRLPGPEGTLRYEFMLHDHEDPEKALDEACVRTWIRARDPGDADLPITRKVVYTFHARVANRWRAGRVLLAGDAAHLTPPFAGQGMNSGLRDVANLSWKLAAVVNSGFAPSLVDSYEEERRPHVWSLIQMAVRIGAFMQPKSAVNAMVMQAALKLVCLFPPARDYILHLKFKPKPRFQSGFFVGSAAASLPIPAGQLLPQPLVELQGGTAVRLDDVLGTGFAVVVASDAIVAEFRRILDGARVPYRVVKIVLKAEDFIVGHIQGGVDAIARDSDGVLEDIMRKAGADVMFVRPDRYVLGYANSGDSRSIDALKQLFDCFVLPVSEGCESGSSETRHMSPSTGEGTVTAERRNRSSTY
ncbi:bifunctional 3-(3-hydroxy-phenyl)propionate/3-hydroxycinnamic acid hydroxylase [Paraburkholderia sp. BL25I1N1]|uniref:bifunctional 3-(3-hydroxy-phenyl)propionate/3-hydroxycinnamic acid hydroxylase n=1 Tax=Paraburkholderia sp. BL25I1N1 TaxID=1938804 RepID=UPI000D06DB1F|nr:bifunctional 3-(3-hydroxy-phenyl)propionate/3-hydroxycinnamic acid hydroxylase [Paraburkholderia sp. BL25I1N1]PRX92094.1 3-(3-hydroxy-phenyl)propionate hydroxylase [Paraburkholderia sp. BL25I1N1]